METNVKTTKQVEAGAKKEFSIRKLLNVIGIFIFGGLALTNLTNPLSSAKYTTEFLMFISGTAIFYYILVNMYFIGGVWKKVFYSILILLGGFSLVMAFYLTGNTLSH